MGSWKAHPPQRQTGPRVQTASRFFVTSEPLQGSNVRTRYSIPVLLALQFSRAWKRRLLQPDASPALTVHAWIHEYDATHFVPMFSRWLPNV